MGYVVLRVRPAPTRFPTNILYNPVCYMPVGLSVAVLRSKPPRMESWVLPGQRHRALITIRTLFTYYFD